MSPFPISVLLLIVFALFVCDLSFARNDGGQISREPESSRPTNVASLTGDALYAQLSMAQSQSLYQYLPTGTLNAFNNNHHNESSSVLKKILRDLKANESERETIWSGERNTKVAMPKHDDREIVEVAQIYFRPLSRYRELLQEKRNRTMKTHEISTLI